MSVQPIPSSEVKQPVRRKRGGQPGNSNAFKHGFYTKNYSLAERRGLTAIEGVVLGDEIKLLRVLIKRFAEQIQASQGVALPQSAQCLAVISEAMLRLVERSGTPETEWRGSRSCALTICWVGPKAAILSRS